MGATESREPRRHPANGGHRMHRAQHEQPEVRDEGRGKKQHDGAGMRPKGGGGGGTDGNRNGGKIEGRANGGAGGGDDINKKERRPEQKLLRRVGDGAVLQLPSKNDYELVTVRARRGLALTVLGVENTADTVAHLNVYVPQAASPVSLPSEPASSAVPSAEPSVVALTTRAVDTNLPLDLRATSATGGGVTPAHDTGTRRPGAVTITANDRAETAASPDPSQNWRYRVCVAPRTVATFVLDYQSALHILLTPDPALFAADAKQKTRAGVDGATVLCGSERGGPPQHCERGGPQDERRRRSGRPAVSRVRVYLETWQQAQPRVPPPYFLRRVPPLAVYAHMQQATRRQLADEVAIVAATRSAHAPRSKRVGQSVVGRLQPRSSSPPPPPHTNRARGDTTCDRESQLPTVADNAASNARERARLHESDTAIVTALPVTVRIRERGAAADDTDAKRSAALSTTLSPTPAAHDSIPLPLSLSLPPSAMGASLHQLPPLPPSLHQTSSVTPILSASSASGTTVAASDVARVCADTGVEDERPASRHASRATVVRVLTIILGLLGWTPGPCDGDESRATSVAATETVASQTEVLGVAANDLPDHKVSVVDRIGVTAATLAPGKEAVQQAAAAQDAVSGVTANDGRIRSGGRETDAILVTQKEEEMRLLQLRDEAAACETALGQLRDACQQTQAALAALRDEVQQLNAARQEAFEQAQQMHHARLEEERLLQHQCERKRQLDDEMQALANRLKEQWRQAADVSRKRAARSEHVATRVADAALASASSATLSVGTPFVSSTDASSGSSTDLPVVASIDMPFAQRAGTSPRPPNDAPASANVLTPHAPPSALETPPRSRAIDALTDVTTATGAISHDPSEATAEPSPEPPTQVCLSPTMLPLVATETPVDELPRYGFTPDAASINASEATPPCAASVPPETDGVRVPLAAVVESKTALVESTELANSVTSLLSASGVSILGADWRHAEGSDRMADTEETSRQAATSAVRAPQVASVAMLVTRDSVAESTANDVAVGGTICDVAACDTAPTVEVTATTDGDDMTAALSTATTSISAPDVSQVDSETKATLHADAPSASHSADSAYHALEADTTASLADVPSDTLDCLVRVPSPKIVHVESDRPSPNDLYYVVEDDQ